MPAAAIAAAPPTTVRTRVLLAAGVAAAPLFVLSVVAQEATRAGFDPRRHPLSLLSLGDLGWIQICTFVVAGGLAFASAFGLRRALRGGRAATWGPILIGAYGVALVWGGVFVADPAFGYPVGTPDSAPASMSWHGALHGIAPAAASVALIVACFVFARRFRADGRRGWAAYSVAAAVVSPVLTAASFAAGDYRLMLAGGAFTWLWASAVCLRVLRRS
jgi:hypothetical protein